MAQRMVKSDDEDPRPLQCPRCGNCGESAFNADTYVLIGLGGVPTLVGSYADAPDPQIDCHGCDYKGPIGEFTQRHRPAQGATHRRGRRSDELPPEASADA